MIKLNRITEYGLMALRLISRRSGEGTLTSAREIADHYGLPFEITAKTLQRLRDTGLIQSSQGARGGYTLKRSLKEVSLTEFLQSMEGPQSVVACATPSTGEAGAGACDYQSRCDIKQVMNHLNTRVFEFLGGIRLSELTEDLAPTGAVEAHALGAARQAAYATSFNLKETNDSFCGGEP